MRNRTTSYRSAFILLVSLFFMWAFLTALNDILVPFVKDLFEFGYAEAALVQFCFFGAFFLMGVPAAKLLERVGYKWGIVIGLALMGLGALLFYPASVMVYYPVFLGALFVLATGVTVLQVAANPYVAVLGPPETAASRLNLAQGFNSVAKIIAPMFGSVLILSNISGDQIERAQAVQLPYIGLALALFLLAVAFAYQKLPDIADLESVKEANVQTDKTSILQFPHLWLGVMAIFMYVGAEVAIASFLISFIGEDTIGGLRLQDAAKYLSFYWGGLMVGRFIGAAILQRIRANKLLAVMAALAIGLLLIGTSTTGWTAAWAIVLIGFCNSIMWSNIFTLSIAGLGKYTSQGSGFLVMGIVGGAIIPLLQGALADGIGLQASYLLPIVCYLYILYFAIKGYRVGQHQV